MRAISNSIQQLLVLDNVSTFFLVTFVTYAGTVYHTNLPYDITITGLSTFLADNTLLSVDPPRQSSSVDRETYRISYADPNFIFRPYFENGMIGADISIRLGFFNTSDATIGSTPVGKPFTDSADTIIIYEGTIDTHGYNVTEDAVTIGLEGSSPMSDLGLSKPFFTSKDSLRQVNVNDTAFDQVFQGSKTVYLYWGKVE